MKGLVLRTMCYLGHLAYSTYERLVFLIVFPIRHRNLFITIYICTFFVYVDTTSDHFDFFILHVLFVSPCSFTNHNHSN